MAHEEGTPSLKPSKFTALDFPLVPSYDFIDAFSRCYGNKGLRTMLQTDYFIGSLVASICSGRSHTANLLGTYPLKPGTVLDGEVAGAQAVGMEVEGEGFSTIEEFYHLVLKDVVVVSDEMPLADSPSEKVLVPIYYPNEVYLYGQ